MTVRREMAMWRATRAMRDERERRDEGDGLKIEDCCVRNFELQVSPSSRESGIDDCSRSAQE